MNIVRRLSDEQALGRIHEKCNEKDVEFIGFKNEDNTYKNNKTYLILKCNKCGNIWSSTSYDKFVTQNRGCPNCIRNKRLTEDEVIEKVNGICKEKGFTFLGFNGEFNGIDTKLSLRCNKCGKEWNMTTYNNFSRSERKSHSCGKKNPSSMPSTLDEDTAVKRIEGILNGSSLCFIRFKEGRYVGRNKSHILLRCEKCGEIGEYLYRGLVSMNRIPCCKYCEYKGKISNEEAIRRVNEKCKYLNYEFLGFDNSSGRYENKSTYLVLRCNECGAVWKTTTYYSFIHNDIKCPSCTNSWKMEKEIEHVLRKYNIEFIPQCRNRILPWLTNKSSLSLDFYLPKYGIAIECQGRQHFEQVVDFGGEKSFKESLERDKKKLELCKEHNVKVLYYDSEHGHKEFLNEKVFNSKEEIINEVFSNTNNT